MSREPGIIRFGVFELHLAAGELRKNGARVRLQEQPFQVLAALLERPGEVVSKEDLKERLWAGDTFVDFDHSLSTAVNKIREALGDSASSPRFIETVPRRGYRFLLEIPQVVPATISNEPSGSLAGPGRRLGILSGPSGRILASCLALLGLGAAWYFFERSSQQPPAMKWSEPRRITSNSGLTFQPTISNDGTLIAYSSDRAGEGNLDIWVQQTAGGTPIQITTDPADDIEPHFSPDGKQIAFRSGRGEGGIYIAPALGGYARLVAPGGHRPRFSPDGRSISYYTGLFVSSPLLPIYPGGDCYVVAVAGGPSTRLAVDAYGAADPVWSPDGSMLLVRTAKKTYDPAGYEWRVVSPDGVDQGATEAVRAIQESPASNVFHVYRPEYWDSDGFVYFCSRDEDNVDLWRIRVDGKSGRAVGPPEQVLAGTGAYYGPAISQGGRLVIADIRVNADVWSLGIDADRGKVLDSQPIRLTDAEGFDTSPAVSLDGSKIVYRSERSGKRETWLLDVESRQERPLLEATGRPAISASGKRIAVNNQDGQVSLLSVDGPIEKQFSGDFPWDWTPDETLVLFNRLDGDQRAIFLFEIGSGKTTRLIADLEQSFFQGQFSPDGRWIAWMAGQSGTIWLAPFRGPQQIPESDWIRISDGSRYSDKPRWSPSGELLYYTRDHEGLTCIYAQPLDRETKQPKGELLEIYHSHDARLSIANIGLPSLEIDVARDKIIFGMAELSGNLWMMEPTH